MSYSGIYQARSTNLNGKSLDVFVPQLFGDMPVKVSRVVGNMPVSTGMGWVIFQGGDPAYPVWIGDVVIAGTSSAGVNTVVAGTGIAVDSSYFQSPIVSNTGVLSVAAGARVTVNNTDPQRPTIAANPQYAAGGATDTILAKNSAADYDTKWIPQPTLNFLPLSGGTMTGGIVMDAPAGGEAIKLTSNADYIGFWNEGTREGYLQGSTGGMSLSADVGNLILGSASGRVLFPASVNVGVPANFPGYGGLNWSNGNYVIMTNGTDTFVTAPATGGQVTIRGGSNNGYQFNINASGNHQIIGNVNHAGYSIDGLANVDASGIITCRGFNLYGTNSFYFADYGGGWYMTDGQWIRATNNKDVYSAGTFQMGALQCNGGASTAGLTTDDINTRGQRRIISNGGNGGGWPSHAFLAQNGADTRTGYSMHPGGVAKSIDMLQNNGYINFLNEGGDWYADLYAASITQVSQKRGKQDIVAWPPKSAGAAVMGAVNRLSLIDVISYRIKPELALIQAESLLPDENGKSHMRVHDCDIDDCNGTLDEPCQRVKDWSTPQLGVIIEDLATVLPEAVGLDPDGNPGGMRLGSMIGYLLAVCKEQQERIEALEHHLEAA